MTRLRQAENGGIAQVDCVLPQCVESYDVMAQRQLYSGGVSKKERGKKEDRGGREQWDGARIREIRDDRKLSQDELAEAARVSAGDISRHERNDIKSNPSVDSLVRIALALHVPMHVLFQPVGSPIPRPDQERRSVESSGEDSPLLERLVKTLDAEYEGEDSWRGDVLKAVAALNRALRRADPAPSTGTAGKTRS